MKTLPIQLNQASGVPYYRQIVDQVSLLIRSGRLKPNEQLPSFRDLAGQLLVSLITIRRAYADLEAAGLIVLKQGSGTLVAEDVETASRGQARAEAVRMLKEAVSHARQLGCDTETIRRILEDVLATEPTKNMSEEEGMNR
jgi:GntR family transcriptional regulator